jgi:outer membrane protein OmpA-like peptidoglycan-associated protein
MLSKLFLLPVKYTIIISIMFLTLPRAGVCAQEPGDPDSTNVKMDSIQFRTDSLMHLGDPRFTYSPDFNFQDSSELNIALNPEYYIDRYKGDDLMYKVIDNWGNGFDALYGTRNVRPILHGVAYRGGANNYFHSTKKRKNSNPLPADGIDNLCEEGFSASVYLYRTNFDDAPIAHTCNCSEGGLNEMAYAQYDYYDKAHIYEMLKMIYESATNDSVGPVYLHCWNGWHASGFISAVILKQFCGMSSLDASAYWDLGTDGANTSPRYNKIRQNIRDFQPYPEFMITDEQGNKICPPMPEFIDSSELHLTVEHLAIVPEAIPVGTIMIMEKVKFGPNKTSFSNTSSNPDLTYLMDALNKSQDLRVEIAGHTDKSGKAATNKTLSNQRAKFVYDYLISQGISADRLTYKGYGHYKPAYTNRTKDGRSANRRIEIKVLTKSTGSLDKLVDEEPYKAPYEKKEELHLVELPNYAVGTSVIMEKVIFEPNMTHINDTNSPQLDELVILMNANPNMQLEVNGFTDKSGIPEKNIIISQNRAKAVYDYLVSKGISSDRLSHHGFGESNPIAPNKYRWGRDKNRRIEVKITAK